MHTESAIKSPASPVAAVDPKRRSMFAKAMSVLHGDKYMVGAYSDTVSPDDATAPDPAALSATPSKGR